jgi:hypothetical protein
MINTLEAMQGTLDEFRERKNMKTGHVAPDTPKMSPGVQNMKKGPATPGVVENESRSAKYENRTRRHWYRKK